MPSITLRARETDESNEETLTEYLCDWPGCPNIAEHVVGVICELRAFSAVCPEHAKLVDKARAR
jgi:hypothetical protein